VTDIPVVETYRGVGIHDRQPRRRIDEVVRPAIDQALALKTPRDLHDYMVDGSRPPEARAVAAAKLLALFEKAAADRHGAPDIGTRRDLPYVATILGCLTSQACRGRETYSAFFDPRPMPGAPAAARREPPWDWYDANPGVMPP
jgi:hypothetical protein